MIEKFFGSEPDEAGSEDDNTDRDTLKKILVENDSVIQFMNEDTKDTLVCRVSADRLSDLSELDCFVDNGMVYMNSVDFAARWDSDVECFISITDTEDNLEVQIDKIVATDVSNRMIRDFTSTFRTEFCTDFDPMAENHNQPHLSIAPF